MTLTDYNKRNNTSLSNDKTGEAMHKIMEEESILDANNINVDTFSHMSNTKRQNTDAIFTGEKLDKPDDLADELKYLTINGAGYYISNSVSANDIHGNLTRNLKTVTHTSKRKEKIRTLSTGIWNKNY